MMLNKYELVEFNILKYINEGGRVWKVIASNPSWKNRFGSEGYMELPAILIDMYEKEYFDLPEEYNGYRLALGRYKYDDLTNYNIMKEKIEKLLNNKIEVLITAEGISYLRELEDKMSKDEIQPQVIQQFFASVKNVTGSGDIHNTEIVIEKFFSNLVERIPDLPNEKKEAIKRQLPHKVKEFAQSISTIAFSALLNWLLSNVKP